MVSRENSVVIIPVYRSGWDPHEITSFKWNIQRLEGYWIVIVAPEGLLLDEELAARVQIERFPKHFFAGIAGYNRMLLSRSFYARFASFEWLLICQLDALVIGDLGGVDVGEFDYVGAPVVESSRYSDEKWYSRIRNGGLSLRKVSSFLRVLEHPFIEVDRRRSEIPISLGLMNHLVYYLLSRSSLSGLPQRYISWFPYNEDVFWSVVACEIDPTFSACDLTCGTRFAFDNDPEYRLLNGVRQGLFGLHGWQRYPKEVITRLLGVELVR